MYFLPSLEMVPIK